MDHRWSAETDRREESGTSFGEAGPPGVAADRTGPSAGAGRKCLRETTENDAPAGASGGFISKSREPRAESREPRAESREPRAELRPQCAGVRHAPAERSVTRRAA